jgi:hypothetical protein
MHFKVMRGQANTISFQTAELAPGIKGSLMAIMELLAVQTIPLSRSNYVSISIEWNIVSPFGPFLIYFFKLQTILLGRFREKLDITPT